VLLPRRHCCCASERRGARRHAARACLAPPRNANARLRLAHGSAHSRARARPHGRPSGDAARTKARVALLGTARGMRICGGGVVGQRGWARLGRTTLLVAASYAALRWGPAAARSRPNSHARECARAAPERVAPAIWARQSAPYVSDHARAPPLWSSDRPAWLADAGRADDDETGLAPRGRRHASYRPAARARLLPAALRGRRRGADERGAGRVRHGAAWR
jgi:hypothetical protein